MCFHASLVLLDRRECQAVLCTVISVGQEAKQAEVTYLGGGRQEVTYDSAAFPAPVHFKDFANFLLSYIDFLRIK